MRTESTCYVRAKKTNNATKNLKQSTTNLHTKKICVCFTENKPPQSATVYLLNDGGDLLVTLMCLDGGKRKTVFTKTPDKKTPKPESDP